MVDPEDPGQRFQVTQDNLRRAFSTSRRVTRRRFSVEADRRVLGVIPKSLKPGLGKFVKD